MNNIFFKQFSHKCALSILEELKKETNKDIIKEELLDPLISYISWKIYPFCTILLLLLLIILGILLSLLILIICRKTV